jgi:hypothetical protein
VLSVPEHGVGSSCEEVRHDALPIAGCGGEQIAGKVSDGLDVTVDGCLSVVWFAILLQDLWNFRVFEGIEIGCEVMLASAASEDVRAVSARAGSISASTWFRST